jgi:protein TonB
MPIVYVADRDPVSRKGLAHALRQRGIDVEEFQSGPALYARVLTQDPDLIVLETDLEEMDGFQVFSRLHRKRPEKPFPVLFVTDFDHPRVARICRERGAIGYVAKSRPPEQVLDAILAAMDRPDPLVGRKLTAALAWLQSHGKTGRLAIDARGRAGYVVLHKGRVLEAEWGPWRGDDVVSVLAERAPEASYRFTEGVDDVDLPVTAPAAEARESAATRTADEPAAAHSATKQKTSRPSSARPVSSTAPAAGAPTSFAPPATPAASPEARRSRRPISFPAPSFLPGAPDGAIPRGAVAAARELHEAKRARILSGRGRRILAAAAVVVLFTATGLGLAAFYSAPLPARVRDILTLIRLGEGGDVVEGPPPPPRAAMNPEPTSPASGEAVSEAAPEVVAAGRGEGDLPGRFDVAPAVVGGPGPSFGPGSEQRPADEHAAPAPAPARASSAPQRKPPGAPAPSAGRQRPAAQPPPRRTPVEEEPALTSRPGPSVAATPTPDETRARAPEVEAGGQAAGLEREAPDSERAAPPLEREPAPPAPAAATGVVPVPREDVTIPGGVSGAPSEATVRAAGEGKPLLKKPILLRRSDELYYPPELKTRGVGGSVLLNIRVGENGRARQVEIAKSSGYEAFDQAAVAAVGTFLWDPAQNADGPTEAWITQAVTFNP